jgi:hypothetical protein
MKPKQAAALLTNDNKYLVHCVVKGIKRKYEPVLDWLKDIQNYSFHLTKMIIDELDYAFK